MVSVFRLPHTLLNESFRLQFPFVFRQLQSLQLLLLAHPCLPLSLPAFSGPSVPRLITASLPLSDPRCFRFLSSASVLGSDYSASVSSFPFSSRFCLTAASSVLRSHFRSFGFPRSLLPGFPCIPSRFRYSAFLFVSFHPSSLRSHSCSTSACLLFRFRFSSGIFCSASAFFRPLLLSFRLLSLLFLPFRSSRFCLSVASPVLPLRFRFLAFPVPSRLVSHPFSPGFRTRLSVGFLSSFPASLPQLFHR